MQGGAKKTGESIKETAANIGASAKSGLEKTKATVQEKVIPFISYKYSAIFLVNNTIFQFNFFNIVIIERFFSYKTLILNSS